MRRDVPLCPETRRQERQAAAAARARPFALYTRRDARDVPALFSAAAGAEGRTRIVNPFTLLVAVVLSAQATDAGVNKATRPLFAVADTPQKMLALGEENVGDYIRTIGLWRNKAKNVDRAFRGTDPRPWRQGA